MSGFEFIEQVYAGERADRVKTLFLLPGANLAQELSVVRASAMRLQVHDEAAAIAKFRDVAGVDPRGRNEKVSGGNWRKPAQDTSPRAGSDRMQLHVRRHLQSRRAAKASADRVATEQICQTRCCETMRPTLAKITLVAATRSHIRR